MIQMKRRVKKGKHGNRSGMTIVETGFAILIGLVVIGASIAAYNKMYIPMKGDAAYQTVSSVLSATERVKSSNNNVYPVAATANISTIALLENELGGATNSRDVANWTYDCSAGSGQTITITTTAFDDPTVASIASQKVNTNSAPWTATVAGNIVTATLANVTCN